MGRPRIPLSEKEVASIEAMSGYGMTMTQIASVLGMSKATLERRMKDSPPELAAKLALERGRNIAISNVTKTAFDLAKSGKNDGMTQFWLQCRAGWKKAGGNGVTVEASAGSKEEDSAPKVIVTIPDNGRD